MDLLVFDTESRTTILRLTRSELLNMDAEFLGTASNTHGRVTRAIRTTAGTVEIYLDEDPT